MSIFQLKGARTFPFIHNWANYQCLWPGGNHTCIAIKIFAAVSPTTQVKRLRRPTKPQSKFFSPATSGSNPTSVFNLKQEGLKKRPWNEHDGLKQVNNQHPTSNIQQTTTSESAPIPTNDTISNTQSKKCLDMNRKPTYGGWAANPISVMRREHGILLRL